MITGHSDTMTRADFVDYGEFNRLFLDHAKASLAAGKTPEQAAADLKLPRSSALTTSRGAAVPRATSESSTTSSRNSIADLVPGASRSVPVNDGLHRAKR